MIGIYKPAEVYADARVERTDIGIGDIGVKANMQKVPAETNHTKSRGCTLRSDRIDEWEWRS